MEHSGQEWAEADRRIERAREDKQGRESSAEERAVREESRVE